MAQDDARLMARIDALIGKAMRVQDTYSPDRQEGENWTSSLASTLDDVLYAEWKAQSDAFLVQLFGPEHSYTQRFRDWVHDAHVISVDKGVGVLRSVREDVEHGYLTDLRTLIEANVFTDFLDMAEHLRERGYWQPAASLVGAVLEDGLRRIAMNRAVVVKSTDDLSALNQKCAQKGVYTRLVQQQIQTWNTIRNSADHGKFEEFADRDVMGMLSGVRMFLADYLR